MGIDIDPLAVVAARANYVLALGPLVGAAGKAGLDLPVYLADSIVSPRIKELSAGDRLVLETAAGRFELPLCVDTAKELRDACDFAAQGLEEGWTAEITRLAPGAHVGEEGRALFAGGVLRSLRRACTLTRSTESGRG